MATYVLAAGFLAFVVGAAHSLLGEVLIFRHLRSGGLVPAVDAPPIRERHIRILWATWHLATVFGWALAAVLLRLASPVSHSSLQSLVLHAIALAFLAVASLVLIATKGRHPGGVGLSAVAVLPWLAASST